MANTRRFGEFTLNGSKQMRMIHITDAIKGTVLCNGDHAPCYPIGSIEEMIPYCKKCINILWERINDVHG